MEGLRGVIEFVRSREKELRLFNCTGDLADALRTHFDTQNVRIATAETASGTPAVGVLSDRETVLTRADVPALWEFVVRKPQASDGLGVSEDGYEHLLAPLKETTFTSYDSEQLLYASREIEDRARRVGSGTVHAGFQSLSVMADQGGIYRDLARTGLEVHTYGRPDAPAPDIGSGQVHAVETEEIARSWFVVFDGDGDDSQKSALLAQTEPGSGETFFGFWTYDPLIVDQVAGYLENTYFPAVDSSTSRSHN